MIHATVREVLMDAIILAVEDGHILESVHIPRGYYEKLRAECDYTPDCRKSGHVSFFGVGVWPLTDS